MKWPFWPGRRRPPASENPPVPRIETSSRADDADYDDVRAAFTAAVSHELRTPLARILALLDWAALPGADTADLVQRARGEVAEVAALVDDLLFVSELETGQQIVSLGRTPVAPIVDETLERYRDEALRAAVRVTVDVQPDVEVPLRPRMLRVVVDNLVENAVQHAGADATLLVEARRTDDAVVLVASDDGVGVPEADLARIFERFFRGDRARSRRGSGLGLAIVKHVVTASGGVVDAASGPGRGLRIRCVFPTRA